MELAEFLQSLSDDELRFIANLDYGVDSDLHLDGLRKLISEQDCVLAEGQDWYPYEVIELGAHKLTPGHEREFAACTLIVLQAVTSGYDDSTNLEWKFDEQAQSYDLLSPELRDAVLHAYTRARNQYDTSPQRKLD